MVRMKSHITYLEDIGKTKENEVFCHDKSAFCLLGHYPRQNEHTLKTQ